MVLTGVGTKKMTKLDPNNINFTSLYVIVIEKIN